MNQRCQIWNCALISKISKLCFLLALSSSIFLVNIATDLSAVGLAQEVTPKIVRASSANREGWQLYKAQKYPEAVVKFLQATQETPKDPKPYWGLALAYNQLKRPEKAKQSLDLAVKLDPTISFTERPTYNKIRQIIEKKIAQSPKTAHQPANAQTSPKQGTNLELAALKTDVAIVDVSMTKLVDVAQLTQIANEVKPFTIKFIIKPKIDGDRLAYAKRVFSYLNLKQGAVIVATQRGVDIYSDRLSNEQAIELSKASRIEFKPDRYTPGLIALTRSAVAEVQRQDGQNKGIGFVAFTLLAGSVAAFTIHRRYKWKEVVTKLQEQRYQVSTNLDDVGSYTKVLPESDAASQSRNIYQRAVEEFIRASEIVDAPPKNYPQIRQAESLLASASQYLREARRAIDLATGVAAISIDETTNTPDYVACFFTSQPLRASEAQVRTIDINGMPQRVLCSPACAAQIDRGQIPNIRAVRQNNTYIPWYRAPDYNPYRDYYSYDREWIVVSYHDIQPEYRQSETVVVTPDRSEYRDYSVQQVEQKIAWNSPTTFESTEETQSDTDFYRSDNASEASMDETARETDFFTGDLS